MKYQALYRAYRPQLFSDMVGQAHITKTLQNAIIQDKVSHAYLFNGPRGTGKTTTAKILAKAINCLNGPSAEPCNECSVCVGINNGEITDIIEIDAASNNGVDEIREIRDKVKYAPTVSKYKVYIIDEVHMLSTGAFNALLKTLEEPPKHVIFILATTEPHKIPLTIISRCQRFDFKKITNKEIVKRLKEIIEQEHVSIEDSALNVVAKLADGGMRDALSLMDQAISFSDDIVKEEDVHAISGTVSVDRLESIISAIIEKNPTLALTTVEEFNELGKDITKLTEDLIFYLRDLILYKNVPDLDEVKNNMFVTEQLKSFASRIQDQLIYEAIEILNQTLNEMKYTNHPKVFLELAIIKLSKSESILEVPKVIEKIVYVDTPHQIVEKRTTEQPIIQQNIVEPVITESELNTVDLNEVEYVENSEENQVQLDQEIDQVVSSEQVEMYVSISERQSSNPPTIELVDEEEEDLSPPDGQVSFFDEMIPDVIEKEEVIELEEEIEYEEQFDITSYLRDVKTIRINNILALASKPTLEAFNAKWKSIILYTSDPSVGPLAGLMLDSKIRVASDHSMMISFAHESFAERCNQQLIDVENFVEKLLNQRVKIIAITDGEWLRIKDEYISRARRGDVYAPILEPSEDKYKIKVKKTIEKKVSNPSKPVDPLIADAIHLFGEDLIEIE